jgi:hypothetical protein
MKEPEPGFLTKLTWSLPWLIEYPRWRAVEWWRRVGERVGQTNLIFVVANHFEPAWNESGAWFDGDTQLSRLEDWCQDAEAIGDAVRDSDGMPFRHTYFYPAEQYHARLLDMLAEHQRCGFGEVEVHLHHGLSRPDTEENLRRTLLEFRDALAERHRCLSRMDRTGSPRYAFVHGNWALANSAKGRWCGVDSEMQVLAETGCYADLSLPSAPSQCQVARINAIYQCGRPLAEAVPHRWGPEVRVGVAPSLPILLTGPLVLDWHRRPRGLPIPRPDCGELAAKYSLDPHRLHRWQSARIGVRGRPEWVFIKLHCHGFFSSDRLTVIGERLQRFLLSVVDLAEQSGQFRVHFATAREAFNLAMAAVDGCSGEPHQYRNYRLRLIMHEPASTPSVGSRL